MKVALQNQLHFDKVFPSSRLDSRRDCCCPAVLSWLIPAANVSFCQFNFVTFVDSVGVGEKMRAKTALNQMTVIELAIKLAINKL